MDRFEGRVAVVTGAASGIGRALCEGFARLGAGVVLADVEAAPLVEAEAAVRGLGVEALSVVTDVASRRSVEALAHEAIQKFGAVHILCNNAGVSIRSSLLETAVEDWRWVHGVNLWGVIHGLHSFLPVLVEQDDAYIVNTASITGLMPGPFSAIYASSKAAVIAISEVLYKEMKLNRPNVGVSVACPAGVRTNISSSMRNRPADLASDSKAGVEALFALDPDTYARSQKLKDQAVSAEEFAQMILDGIRERRFWILPRPEFNEFLTGRALDMAEGRPPRPGPQG